MMSDLIKHLNEPEIYFPGNFDTVKRANALLLCLCQEAADALEAKDAEIDDLKGQCLSMAMELTGIPKYKALCDQMAYAMEMHGEAYLHHEIRYNEPLAAWKEMK